MGAPMTWREVQAALLRNDHQRLCSRCPICCERIAEGVVVLHIEEEHPKVAERIRKATEPENKS